MDRTERDARWGIQAHYTDALGRDQAPSDEAVDEVVDQLRRDRPADEGPQAGDEIAFVAQGRSDLPPTLAGRRLVSEDGTDLGVVPALPTDLPIGYHRLVDQSDGHATVLVVHPPTCADPQAARSWGWALQLPAARSRASWGIGDLADAGTIAAWAQARGGDPVLLLNPLHAPNLGADPQASPYFASSRCFRNPLALRIEEVPGARELGAELDDLALAGRELSAQRRIDRRRVWALKREALDRIWSLQGHDARRAEAEVRMAADPVLRAFAAFTVAVERHGEPWSAWPVELRRPDGPGWPAFVAQHADRVAFEAWVQGAVDEQVGRLAAEIPVVHDLAVGTDGAGFDAWYWQDLFVLDGTRIGAPGDEFNTQGQDWGLPPMDPWRLRAAGYEPFVRMLRTAFSAGAGLRIDHVMGLFRLFWLPAGRGAADGVYVRQPTDDLLALVALESTRAGAFVVGEDLGTVEPGVREALAERRFLSYRVMSLDDSPVEHYPAQSLASISTHDLPTVAGLWTGTDLADQERLGMRPPVEETHAMRAGFGHRIGVAPDAPVEDVVVAAHRTLARARSRIVLAQLEDAALVAERPNMPGTTDEWPNWSLALPHPIEDVLASGTAAAVADATRGTPPPPQH